MLCLVLLLVLSVYMDGWRITEKMCSECKSLYCWDLATLSTSSVLNMNLYTYKEKFIKKRGKMEYMCQLLELNSTRFKTEWTLKLVDDKTTERIIKWTILSNSCKFFSLKHNFFGSFVQFNKLQKYVWKKVFPSSYPYAPKSLIDGKKTYSTHFIRIWKAVAHKICM